MTNLLWHWPLPTNFVLIFQGIPEAAEVAVSGAHFPANQAAFEGDGTGAAAISGVPNSSPLNLFPQVKHYIEFHLHVFSSYVSQFFQNGNICRKQFLVVVILVPLISLETSNRFDSYLLFDATP